MYIKVNLNHVCLAALAMILVFFLLNIKRSDDTDKIEEERIILPSYKIIIF